MPPPIWLREWSIWLMLGRVGCVTGLATSSFRTASLALALMKIGRYSCDDEKSADEYSEIKLAGFSGLV